MPAQDLGRMEDAAMTDDRTTDPDEETAAEGGRSDLDVPDPTQGYGVLPDATDEELREAFRDAEPDPSRPTEE
jgi:hypothetical protein